MRGQVIVIGDHDRIPKCATIRLEDLFIPLDYGNGTSAATGAPAASRVACACVEKPTPLLSDAAYMPAVRAPEGVGGARIDLLGSSLLEWLFESRAQGAPSRIANALGGMTGDDQG